MSSCSTAFFLKGINLNTTMHNNVILSRKKTKKSAPSIILYCRIFQFPKKSHQNLTGKRNPSCIHATWPCVLSSVILVIYWTVLCIYVKQLAVKQCLRNNQNCVEWGVLSVLQIVPSRVLSTIIQFGQHFPVTAQNKNGTVCLSVK